MKKNLNINKKINLMAVIMSSLLISLFSINSQAHGFMETPKARQAICQAQGGYWWPDDGSAIPNLACRAAFLESGYVQFIQEHEIAINVVDYNNQAAIELAVPDGRLCSAGSDEKSGINLPSAHWQKTLVTPNVEGKIQVRFNATTPHNPSFWKIYLSKATFNSASDVLGWQDLELVQEHGNIEFVKAPDGNRYYNMEVDIPADRSGDAVLYTRWQRNDVAGEGFYNCSDITIARDDVDPNQWQAIDYFVKQGDVASENNSVWTRLFDAAGQELIQQHFIVDASNIAYWQKALADKLNQDFSQLIKVGVKNNEGIISFDQVNIFANQVWVTNADYTYNLTIVTQPDNTPPTVNDLADTSMDENTVTRIHVHAFDDEQSVLFYTWQIPEPLTFSTSGANVDITAASVSQAQNYTLSVMVSDGTLTTSKSFVLTVNNLDVDPSVPLWSAENIYFTNDQVNFSNKVYLAKWWNTNEQPDSSQAWKLAVPSDGSPVDWHINNSYVAGSEVIHLSKPYRAKWWTQGEEPGVAAVWQAQ